MIKMDRVAALVTVYWSLNLTGWIAGDGDGDGSMLPRSWMESSGVLGFSNCVPVGCHTEVEPSVAFCWRCYPSHPEGEGSLNLRSRLESSGNHDWDGSMLARSWVESSWILQISNCITLGCHIEVEPSVALCLGRYLSHPEGDESMLPECWIESSWLLLCSRGAFQTKPWANLESLPTSIKIFKKVVFLA